MDRLDQLSGEELDALLRGEGISDDADVRPLADLAAGLRARAHAEPVPVMGYELRRALAQRAAGPTSRRLRRRWLDAVAASAALLAFGAVGAAGALPAPLQEAVSQVGGAVGVELPRADDAAEGAPGLHVATALLGESEDEGTEPKAAVHPDLLAGGTTGHPGAPVGAAPTSDARPPVAPGDEREGPRSGRRTPTNGVQAPGSGAAADEGEEDQVSGGDQQPAGPQEPADPAADEPSEPTEPTEPTEVSKPRPVRPPLR